MGGWENGFSGPSSYTLNTSDISGRTIALPLADVGYAGYAHVGDVADVSSVLHEVVQNIHFVVFGESMGLTFAHC